MALVLPLPRRPSCSRSRSSASRSTTTSRSPTPTRAGARKASVGRFVGDTARRDPAVRSAAANLNQAQLVRERHVSELERPRQRGHRHCDVPLHDQHPRLDGLGGNLTSTTTGASRMIATARSERGQVTVMAAIFVVILVGMAGLVLDVGSWFRQQRVQQTTVDAAALAGAQACRARPSGAIADARRLRRAERRRYGRSEHQRRLASTRPNDAVVVSQTQPGDRVLLAALRHDRSSPIKTKAAAIAEVPTEAQYAAPIVVNIQHPDALRAPARLPVLQRADDDPAREERRARIVRARRPELRATRRARSARVARRAGSSTATTKYLPLGIYFSDPGAKCNNIRSRTR